MNTRRMTEADYMSCGIQPPPGFFPLASGRSFAFGNRLHEAKKQGWQPPVIIKH